MSALSLLQWSCPSCHGNQWTCTQVTSQVVICASHGGGVQAEYRPKDITIVYRCRVCGREQVRGEHPEMVVESK